MTGSAASTEPGTVRLERVLHGPIERVWAYLTEPEKRAKWLAGGPMDLRVGGKVELMFAHHNQSAEPTPAPHKGDVLLVITHRRLGDRKEMVSVASGWDAHVGILDDVLNGRTPRLFWSTHARLEKEYEARL